jgi:hypothetical protein
VDVRRDVVVGRELEALDHYFTSFRRIADEDGDLATLWNVGMIPPCQRVGRQAHVVHGFLTIKRFSSWQHLLA